MSGAVNVTEELCKTCDGRVECAPTAVLLISLINALYGHIGAEPDYFGEHYGGGDESGWYHEEGIKEYDFIIVGGGTAGCVLASRLSENRKWKILLIEAGIEEPRMTLIPALANEFAGSNIDWKFSMRPSEGFCLNRRESGCEMIQGRVLGGTSTINDMAYVRGSPVDYEEWALSGNTGWSYKEVLAYFKHSEGNYDNDVSRNNVYHAREGPLDVGRYRYIDDNVDVLLRALNEMGHNYTDINGRDQLGFMRIQTMTYFGERISTCRAFVEPIRKLRSNLHILTESLVTRILLNVEERHLNAFGVEYLCNGTKTRVKANKEVIIAAGTINSAKLLMQSGIGLRDYLEYLGIHVYLDLPVGANFHDHLSVCLPVIKLTKTATSSNFSDKLRDITHYYAKGSGPLSANFQVLAFMESSISDILDTPDLEIRFKGHDSNMYYDHIDICITLLTPKSRGHVLLNATDYLFGQPLVYPNFLKFPSDEVKILEGIQEMIRLFDSHVLEEAGFVFDPQFILLDECNGEGKATRGFWSCVIRHFSSPAHNYVGTCKMGPSRDPDAVVDPQLRVYGVDNLRIADASIMPTITRGATAAPVIMIAEKASDLIKSTWY